MSELKKLVLKTQTVEATDAQKFHMLVKSIEVLNTGKSAEEAHAFVLSLFKDGYYNQYGNADKPVAKENPLAAKPSSPELTKQDIAHLDTASNSSENLQEKKSDFKSEGSSTVSEKVQEKTFVSESADGAPKDNVPAAELWKQEAVGKEEELPLRGKDGSLLSPVAGEDVTVNVAKENHVDADQVKEGGDNVSQEKL